MRNIKDEFDYINILLPYDNWQNQLEIPDPEVITAIRKFYFKYKKMRTSKKDDTKIEKGYFLPYSQNLCNIKSAIEEQKYQRTCNEIITLLHGYLYKSGYIKFELLKLLNDSFNFEEIKCY